MDEYSNNMLKKYFKQYYFKYGSSVKPPSRIESREFGYFPFGGQMIRHQSFKDIGALRALLFKEAPAGVYCSNSLYEEPTAEMHLKQWLGAEMIFDIDADSLKLPCKRDHDIWFCKQCGRKEFGLRPENCPECGSNRILESTWACRNCLEGTKKETFKLLDFLETDFGISGKEIRVYFSGNAGYHLTVHESTLDSMNQHERAEVSDYLTGQGMKFQTLTTRILPSDPGWRGRLARFIRDLPEESVAFKTTSLEQRTRELVEKFSEDRQEKFFKDVIARLAVRIDPMVTTDIHRIFRMPETLNNKTGLIKREVEDLSSFDPLVESIAIADESEVAQVEIDVCPKIELGRKEYGPYKSDVRKLPLYVCVYLVARGAAKFRESELKATQESRKQAVAN